MKRFYRPLRRALGLVVALFGLGQPLAVQATTPWAANDDDAVLFDVRLGQWRLGDGVRGYHTPEGTCLDMADMIMALDIPVRLDKKLRRATGWAFSERNSLVIDREANTVQIMNRTQKLPDNAVYDTPEGWCVNAQALGSWLGIKLEADTGNAILVIKATEKLPVEMAQERRARAAKVQPVKSFDLRSLPQADAPYRGVKPPAVDAVVNFGLMREGKGSVSPDIQYEVFASGEIGPIAYDARLASDRRAAPESLRVRAYRVDPEGALLGTRFPVTQIAFGDVGGYSTAIVSQANIGRGAMITNRPLDRPDSFDHTDFRGEIPAGWDAELYRNGQLLSLAPDRQDGRYEFLNVPLLYGQNRFEVVLYGPQGQIRREERTVTVGFDSIPPRKTWYWAGVNQDGQDLLNVGGRRFGTGLWRGSLGVERGIDARTAVQLGVHSIGIREVGRRNFLEGSVRRALGPALFEASYASDLRGGSAFRGSVLGEYSGFYVAGESLFAIGGFRSDRVLENVTSRHSLSLDRNVTLGTTIVPLHFDARYTTRRDGQANLDFSSRVSTNIGRMTFSSETSWRRRTAVSGQNSAEEIDTALLAHARIGRLRLRGETLFKIVPVARFESITVIGEWSGQGDIREAADLRADLSYDRTQDRARLGVGYIRRFERFSLTASGEAATDGSVAFGLSFSFSLGADPRNPGHVRMTSSHQASQGQILARVYHDVNGDGKRQADEPLEKDVQLAAGTAPVRDLTDPNGAVIIGDVEPFIPVLIGIDASSLPDPLIQPATPGIVVTPRPGMTVVVDLPLVGTGEVDGTLVHPGGGNLQGVDLELVDLKGHVAARARSEFDGFFLFEAVPYGTYRVQVATLSASVAQIKPTLSGVIRITNVQPSVHLDVVTVEPESPKMATGP
jgi:hypothetical protein